MFLQSTPHKFRARVKKVSTPILLLVLVAVFIVIVLVIQERKKRASKADEHNTRQSTADASSSFVVVLGRLYAMPVRFPSSSAAVWTETDDTQGSLGQSRLPEQALTSSMKAADNSFKMQPNGTPTYSKEQASAVSGIVSLHSVSTAGCFENDLFQCISL